MRIYTTTWTSPPRPAPPRARGYDRRCRSSPHKVLNSRARELEAGKRHSASRLGGSSQLCVCVICISYILVSFRHAIIFIYNENSLNNKYVILNKTFDFVIRKFEILSYLPTAILLLHYYLCFFFVLYGNKYTLNDCEHISDILSIYTVSFCLILTFIRYTSVNFRYISVFIVFIFLSTFFLIWHLWLI